MPILTRDDLGSRNTDTIGPVAQWLGWWRAGGFGARARGGSGARQGAGGVGGEGGLGAVVGRCTGWGGGSGRRRVWFFCALGRRLGRRLRRRVTGGLDEGLVAATGCEERLRDARGRGLAWCGLVRSRLYALSCGRRGLFGRCRCLFLST